ncbi:MAG: putative metalloprotease CJM1_0395 family protein [Desulfobacteraceae bacterium]|jgi:hypothetical protein
MIRRLSATYGQQQHYLPQLNSSNRFISKGDSSSALQAKSAEISDVVNISDNNRNLETDEKQATTANGENLSEDQKRQIDKLKQRDQEVKAHERAHMAAGGGLVQGGASYTYQRGPDGKLYAVGGEVQIDTSSERDPDQTARKMEQVKRAALAPAQPSAADRAVAARASQVELQARIEETQLNEENTDSTNSSSNLGQRESTRSIDLTPYALSENDASPIGHNINLAV